MNKHKKIVITLFLIVFVFFTFTPHSSASSSCLNVRDYGYHKTEHVFWTGALSYGAWEVYDDYVYEVNGVIHRHIGERRSVYQERVYECICGYSVHQYEYITTEYRFRDN